MTVDFDLPVAPGFSNLSEGFLLDEDRALHRHLKGLTVSDDAKNDRPVGVWFSQPDLEVREQKYPYMVITMIDVTEARNRVMSGTVQLPVPSIPQNFANLMPDMVEGFFTDRWIDSWDVSYSDVLSPVIGEDGKIYNSYGTWVDVWDEDTWSFPVEVSSSPPIPAQIDYQIRAFSRHPRHSRQIIRDFLGQKISYRYSWLNMFDIDGSSRRLELLDIGHNEIVEDNKRLFVSSFTIRVDSWLPVQDYTVTEEYAFVTKVLGEVSVVLKTDDVSYEKLATTTWEHPEKGTSQ